MPKTLKDIAKKYAKPAKEHQNSRILVISDMHIPYSHIDMLAFLTALKKKHKFTKIISIGDEVDNHAISFHDSDPNLPGPADELKKAIIGLQAVHRLFPEMDIVKSNHGDLYERKLRHHGLPESIIKSRNEIYQIENGWRFHNEIILELPNGEEVLFHHGINGNVLNAAKSKGMSLVQGHYHSKFIIQYWRTKRQLSWGMNVGCLIDRESLAMLYAREGKDEQIIGCGGIIDSQPRLFPMLLNREGRWTGDTP